MMRCEDCEKCRKDTRLIVGITGALTVLLLSNLMLSVTVWNWLVGLCLAGTGIFWGLFIGNFIIAGRQAVKELEKERLD